MHLKTLFQKAGTFTCDERAALHQLILWAEQYLRASHREAEYQLLLDAELLLLQACQREGDMAGDDPRRQAAIKGLGDPAVGAKL